MSKRVYRAALVALAFLLGATANAYAETVVVPNAFESTESPQSNCIGIGGCISAWRLQQVFDSAEFSMFSVPHDITGIAFRPDAVNGGPFAFDFADVRITLSTTANGPGALSTTFDDNTGADAVVVYRGALALSSAFSGPPGGPKDFDIAVDFQTPFRYDPQLGHLLYEWQLLSEERDSEQMDSVAGNSATSRLFARSNPNAATGTLGSVGLVAQFTATPVPVPPAAVLLAPALAIIARRRHLA